MTDIDKIILTIENRRYLGVDTHVIENFPIFFSSMYELKVQEYHKCVISNFVSFIKVILSLYTDKNILDVLESCHLYDINDEYSIVLEFKDKEGVEFDDKKYQNVKLLGTLCSHYSKRIKKSLKFYFKGRTHNANNKISKPK